METPYILKENDKLQVNPKHPYYFQLQIQMAVCCLKLSYFYIWSPKIQIRIPVTFEPNFWNTNSVKAFRFAKTVIVPELMNSYYTKSYTML